MSVIPYTIYRWTPPELSLKERISLGKEIAKVGRKAFVRALRQRLSTLVFGSNNKQFTFANVIGDAEKLRNQNYAKPSMTAKVVSSLFLGGCVAGILASGLIAPVAMIGSVSGGSLLWMHRKVDRWAQSLIDEYSHSIANASTHEETRPSASH